MSYSHPLPNVEEMAFLKVDNLAKLTSSSTLKHVFEDYGPVSDVYISENHLNEEPYRSAFIHFYNKHDAKNAMGALNGILLDGCKLWVQMVHNDVPQYAQPSCSQGGQYHFKDDNHEFQSHGERHCCSSTSVQSRSHSRSSPGHSESQTQSHSSHRRLSSSTKRSKSSMSDHQLLDKSCPRSRHRLPEKRKKSKSRSSLTHVFECPEGGGENMENKQLETEHSDSDVIFVREYKLEGNRSETLTTCPPITSQRRIRNQDFHKNGACHGGEEDPFHDMLSCDIANYQPTTFQQYDVMEEEKRECQSWTGTSLSKSQHHNFMKGDSVNDNYENPDLQYDHLYFARLLGEEHMQDNDRQVESEQSKSMFNSPYRSEVNATDTLMAVPSTGSRTRKQCRSQQNWREKAWMEREHMKNNQKQMGYLQSESMFKKPDVSKEHKCEALMLYNSSQKRTRRRGPGLPKANNWMRCEAKTLAVVPQGDSKRGNLTSIQQSENRTKSECGFWTTKYHGKTNNDDISGGMEFTFNNENSNPQNDLVFLSEFSCHGSNRNGQKQVHHQQPESTCVIPFTPEEDATKILMEDQFTRDRRSTRSENPEVLKVGEMTESRPPHPIYQVPFVKDHHCVTPETFPHVNLHEPLSNGRPVFPPRDDLNISELQRRHSFTSSQKRKHTYCTACRGQSTSVTPANFTSVGINKSEHTNIFSHSNQACMQNSEIISVAQTSNTGLEFPLATAPYGTPGQILTEILEVEQDNYPEIGLEAHGSSSSQNNRRVHSGDSSISCSVSSSFSHSTSNSSRIPTLLSLSTPSETVLQIPLVLHTTVTWYENLPAPFQINGQSNQPFSFYNPPSEARQRVAGRGESDDSDSWLLLPNFANFNDIHNNHPKGLTKEQINTLPIRAFCENDRLKICTICITEYTESSKICILPCSHEYHHECIDNWLAEKSNCPICRRQIINPPDDTEILF